MLDLNLASLLFMVGFIGSGHCLAMCGGLSAALGMNTGGSKARRLWLLLLTQLGRIVSYGVIGAVFGGSLALVQELLQVKELLMSVRILANLMLIGMGLYIAGWWFGLKRLERLALPIWRKIQPIQTQFIPMTRSYDAIVVGLCWGWLPCGLVYSALVTSVSSNSYSSAAVSMMAFGLGTLPAVWLIGSASSRLQQLINYPPIRVLMALVLISYGIKQLIQIMNMIF